MATREQKYIADLERLGVYDKAFDPEIHTLAIMERDLQRTLKKYRDANDEEEQSAHWAVITQLRRDILAHRDALGLTPKALQRIKKSNSDNVGSGDSFDSIVSRLWGECETYE